MLDEIQDKISQGILDAVNKVKQEKDKYYQVNTEQIHTVSSIDMLIQSYSNKNALISGAASLVPGPLGIATAVPEIIAVTKNQIEMIYDVAKSFGQKEDFF